MYNTINIRLNELYNIITYNTDTIERYLIDNPKYYSRDQLSNLDRYGRKFLEKLNYSYNLHKDMKDCENKYNYLKMVSEEIANNFKEFKKYGSLLTGCYTDPVTMEIYRYSTLLEKIGCNNHVKRNIVWYTLSYNLADILSLLTGTCVDVIKLYLERIANQYNMTLDELSSNYLFGNIFICGLSDLLKYKTCSTIRNLLDNFIDNASHTNYLLCGKLLKTEMTFTKIKKDNVYYWINTTYFKNDSNIIDLTDDDYQDIYIAYCIRIIACYLLKEIHKCVLSHNKEWLNYNNTINNENIKNKSLKEMLVAFSPSELIYQNDNAVEFPVITMIGKFSTTIKITPINVPSDNVIDYFFEDKIKIELWWYNVILWNISKR